MVADAKPDVVCGGEPDPQARLPLAADGVQRVVWRMTYGDILIKIRDGCAYVNGERVTPATETLAPDPTCSQANEPPTGSHDATTRRGP